MILILYSISHLGQKKLVFFFFFMARAGFDVWPSRGVGWLWAELGQPHQHSAMLQQLTAKVSHVGMLSGATNTLMGKGDFTSGIWHIFRLEWC